jgi:hypothetical protein
MSLEGHMQEAAKLIRDEQVSLAACDAPRYAEIAHLIDGEVLDQLERNRYFLYIYTLCKSIGR